MGTKHEWIVSYLEAQLILVWTAVVPTKEQQVCQIGLCLVIGTSKWSDGFTVLWIGGTATKYCPLLRLLVVFNVRKWLIPTFNWIECIQVIFSANACTKKWQLILSVVVPKCFIKHMCFIVLYFHGHAFFLWKLLKSAFLCFIFWNMCFIFVSYLSGWNIYFKFLFITLK